MMKSWVCIVLLLFFSFVVYGADKDSHPKCIFSSLKVDQHIKLTDHGTAYTISYFEKELELPFKVVEIGKDYVIIRDLAGIKDTLIPVYAVKAIVRVGVE